MYKTVTSEYRSYKVYGDSDLLAVLNGTLLNSVKATRYPYTIGI